MCTTREKCASVSHVRSLLFSLLKKKLRVCKILAKELMVLTDCIYHSSHWWSCHSPCGSCHFPDCHRSVEDEDDVCDSRSLYNSNLVTQVQIVIFHQMIVVVLVCLSEVLDYPLLLDVRELQVSEVHVENNLNLSFFSMGQWLSSSTSMFFFIPWSIFPCCDVWYVKSAK